MLSLPHLQSPSPSYIMLLPRKANSGIILDSSPSSYKNSTPTHHMQPPNLLHASSLGKACMVAGEIRETPRSGVVLLHLRRRCQLGEWMHSLPQVTWLSQDQSSLHCPKSRSLLCHQPHPTPTANLLPKLFTIWLQQTTEIQNDQPAQPSMPASTQQESHCCSHTTADPGTCQLGTLCLAATFPWRALMKV